MRPREAEGGDLPGERKETSGGFLDFLKELPVLIVVAFAIALLIKTFLVQAFWIPSSSMEDTLHIQDRVLVSKLTYRFREPKYADVVVFVSPTAGRVPKVDKGPIGNFVNGIAVGLGLRSSENDFIKRVIALEDQTVEVKDSAVWVNGKKLEEKYTRDPNAQIPNYGPIKVPKDHVFVMGDNRANSQDSRVFGPIRKKSIVGRAFVLIWPPGRFEFL